MDRTQELEELRKELFRLRFELVMAKKDPDKMEELKNEVIIVRNKMKKIIFEINQDNKEIEGRKKK